VRVYYLSSFKIIYFREVLVLVNRSIEMHCYYIETNDLNNKGIPNREGMGGIHTHLSFLVLPCC
jgi:hypothetical protein